MTQEVRRSWNNSFIKAWKIGQAIWHNEVLIVPPGGVEGGFPFFPFHQVVQWCTAESRNNGHVSFRTGPRSNGRRWPGLMNHVFFYITWMAGCVCVSYLGNTWHQDALWEEGEPAEAVSCFGQCSARKAWDNAPCHKAEMLQEWFDDHNNQFEVFPTTVDPFQFAYRLQDEDAVNAAIHTAFTHLEGKDTYVRMLFINYSSAFDTVIPHRLSEKLLTLGLTPSLCNWVLNFLTDRPQSVRVGNRTSGIRTVSTGTPQGCVLSPLLYTLFTYDCVASQTSTKIIKFADDTTVIRLITGGEETSYRTEVAGLIAWCQENNLSLNTDKTKEMIILGERRRSSTPQCTS
ncbi:hypothetical protein QTP70_025498, partial [Hemibagrus guttatus]